MKVFYALLLLVTCSNYNLVAGDSLSLYIFLLDDCPICIQYTPTLNDLHKEYGNEISFVGYFPNFSSKPAKIDTYKKKYEVKFPLYTDYFKKKAKKFNAQVTPEVILFNHNTNEVMYQGRIDNMFYKLGRRRKVVTEHDLKTAIQNAISNKVIERPFIEPIGCFINYSDNFGTITKNDKE